LVGVGEEAPTQAPKLGRANLAPQVSWDGVDVVDPPVV
jgi:hypothetical protein